MATVSLEIDPFRTPQEYESPSFGTSMSAGPMLNVLEFPKMTPTPDNIYSDYAAKMADGRLVTDYRPNCATRAPYGHQNATKEWLVKNSQEIIDVSRRRQAEYTGATRGAYYMGPKPAAIVSCTEYSCETKELAGQEGVGVERAQCTAAPNMFGVFNPHIYSADPFRGPAVLNRRNEGGANTVGRRPIDSDVRYFAKLASN
jgi:hypothetical protein